MARPMALRLRSRPSLRPGRWAHSFVPTRHVDRGSRFFASLLLAGAACSAGNRTAAGLRLVDDAGDTVDGPRPGPPDRLAHSRHDRTAVRHRRRAVRRRADDVVRLSAGSRRGPQSRRRNQSQPRGHPRLPSGSRPPLQLRPQCRRGGAAQGGRHPGASTQHRCSRRRRARRSSPRAGDGPRRGGRLDGARSSIPRSRRHRARRARVRRRCCCWCGSSRR